MDHRFLFKFPTMGRLPLFKSTLDKWYAFMSGDYPFEFIVSLNADDKTMHTREARDYLAGKPNLRVFDGGHKNKIQACNADVEEARDDWTILVLVSDDMIPVVKGYDKIIADKMTDTDLMLFFDDGFWGKSKLNTLSIIGRKYYQRDGYIYHPGYESVFADDHQMAVARARDKLPYFPQTIIRHEWIGKTHPQDALHQRNCNQKQHNRDKKLFEEFKRDGFPELTKTQPVATTATTPPPLMLSIMTPTLPGRHLLLARLRDRLQPQLTFHGQVEWLIDNAPPPETIGAKRQRLLEDAKGKYVVCIDDDDLVAPDYVQRLLTAFQSDQDAYGFNGTAYKNGKFDRPFVASNANTRWANKPGLYIRNIYHITPVRRELALKTGFKPINFGEDAQFSELLKPLIKTAGFVDGDPMYIYCYHEAISSCNNISNNQKIFTAADVERTTPDFNQGPSEADKANPPNRVYVTPYGCNDKPLRQTPW